MDNDQGGVEQDEDWDEQEKSRSSLLSHPRVRQTVQRDHPINNILGSIEKGVTTQSRVATFYEYYSFISSFEPFKVKDAQLQEKPSGSSVTNKLNLELLQGTRQDLWPMGIHKLKVWIFKKHLLP
jgi:hypothetical protein